MKQFFLFFIVVLALTNEIAADGLPLYYWREPHWTNFGDYLSLMLVERIVGEPISVYKKKKIPEKKLLAIGSILSFANDEDIIWGSGVNGKRPFKEHYLFTKLDVRAVRGPLTQNFLYENFGIEAPSIYGDPALLIPYFFPEFERKENPQYPYLIIPHYSDISFFPRSKGEDFIIYPTDPWNDVIEKILDSEFVISSSLHGVILAEAFGIPARLLRVTEKEPLLKYQDYYYGTGRFEFKFANSIEEALLMGGEEPFNCDLEKLYHAFPFEIWPQANFKHIDFSCTK